MNQAVIVGAARSAVGRAVKGSLSAVRPEDMLAQVLRATVERAGVDPARIEDVIIGCAFPEAEQGLNVARLAALKAGLPVSVSAQTVNRQCASGLQTIAMGAWQIMTGSADVVLAGGVESMSRVPIPGQAFRADPDLMEQRPGAYLNMGLTAENLAREHDISREDQDAFALRSHQRAGAAQAGGRFDDQIVPLDVEGLVGNGSRAEARSLSFAHDEGIRSDTSAAKLAALRPVFHSQGTVTAGNSSQMSDGAAAVVLMNEDQAHAEGLVPLARFRSYATAGVDPETMGIGPVSAIPKALKQAGLDLDDVDLVELNEAFAAQALAVIRSLELDEEHTNVNGGAIALGHPLGATGSKLTAQILAELKERDQEIGMVTMCVGGGMGAAGIFERLN